MIGRRLPALLVMVVVTASGMGLICSDSGGALRYLGACKTQVGPYAADSCLRPLAR